MYHKYVKYLFLKVAFPLLMVFRRKIREALNGIKSHENKNQIFRYDINDITHSNRFLLYSVLSSKPHYPSEAAERCPADIHRPP